MAVSFFCAYWMHGKHWMCCVVQVASWLWWAMFSQGWTKTNAFHVCITSYKLVVQDHQAFRRKKWKYLILDEVRKERLSFWQVVETWFLMPSPSFLTSKNHFHVGLVYEEALLLFVVVCSPLSGGVQSLLVKCHRFVFSCVVVFGGVQMHSELRQWVLNTPLPPSLGIFHHLLW